MTSASAVMPASTTFHSAIDAHAPNAIPGMTLEIAPNIVVPAERIKRGSQTVMLIVGLFLFGALLVASLVLNSGMLAIGTFVGFSIMMLIGMPLILACVGDALEHAAS